MQDEGLVAQYACHGGMQSFYEHPSRAIGLPMRYGVFRPGTAGDGPVPIVVFLAGLTCNEETFAIKAGAQRHAAELGLVLVTPDTSPRKTGVAHADDAWDLGTAAGFYLDATEAPWASHWRMESYLIDELVPMLRNASGHPSRPIGILGHSMGGHGALTLALRHPGVFKSVSALAPICAPVQCPWGVKAFTAYLGSDRAAWQDHDACELVRMGRRLPDLLIDQGMSDKFLADQLNLNVFERVCATAGQPVTVRRREGYDHGYYFISTFIADHLAHHRKILGS